VSDVADSFVKKHRHLPRPPGTRMNSIDDYFVDSLDRRGDQKAPQAFEGALERARANLTGKDNATWCLFDRPRPDGSIAIQFVGRTARAA
jgi:hypothetical protein